MPGIALIAGLGNPGPRYDQTRHNAGFWFVDALAAQQGCRLRQESRFQAMLGRCASLGEVRLMQPLGYMNRSGQPVAAVLRYFGLAPESLLVAHDDLDLEPGVVRLKRGGGHGGHNGLKDIIAHLGSRDFLRLRIGIGHPGERDRVVDYVLGRPGRDERAAIDTAIRRALDVMPLVVEGRVEAAMNELHAGQPPSRKGRMKNQSTGAE